MEPPKQVSEPLETMARACPEAMLRLMTAHLLTGYGRDARGDAMHPELAARKMRQC